MMPKSVGLLFLGLLLSLMTIVSCDEGSTGMDATAGNDRKWVVIWFSNPDNSGEDKPGPEGNRDKGVPSPQAPPETPMSNTDMVDEFNHNANGVHCSQHDRVFEEGATWWCTGQVTPAYYAKISQYPNYGKKVLASVQYVDDMKPVSSVSAPMNEHLTRDNTTIKVADNVNAADYGAQRMLKMLSMSQAEWQAADATRKASGDPHYDVYQNAPYKYRDQPGKTSRVYIVDTGINSESTAFRGRGVEYILAQPFNNEDRKDVAQNAANIEYGHGTCMADLAVGKDNGVARDAEVTSVTLNAFDHGFLQKLAREQLIDGLTRAWLDMMDKGLSNRAVVSMSIIIYTDPGPYEEAYRYALWTMLKRFENYGVAIVVAAPNHNECTPQHTPCIFANPLYNHNLPWGSPLDTVVAVGNADIDTGDYVDMTGSYSAWLPIFGPGSDKRAGGLHCVGPIGNSPRVDIGPVGGTSHATAAVAGLMAYFLDKLGDAQNAYNQLIASAYGRADTRVYTGPKMPYNEQ